jgi:hypothetical protein
LELSGFPVEISKSIMLGYKQKQQGTIFTAEKLVVLRLISEVPG